MSPLSASPATRPRLSVHRLAMAHPGDVSALQALIDDGAVAARDVVAVIGKTEGNGGVNDFTRGYFTQSLMALLSRCTGQPAEQLVRELPCVLSGGTEGVLSPHYVVFVRHRDATEAAAAAAAQDAAPNDAALAIGTAMSSPVPAQDIGRWAQVRAVAATVQQAMREARIERPEDVAFVQVKGPCVTATRARAAQAAGHAVRTADAGRSMAFSRAAGAFGVALALGEIADDPALEAAMLRDFDFGCARASVSSGVEVEVNEVIVLGHSTAWDGPLRMRSAPMQDALDIGAVTQLLHTLGLEAAPQLASAQTHRVAAAFVKCEPDPRGMVRGARHTMLDDTDIDAQRHIRGAVGALVAGVLGDTRLFVSGGAEHQGPAGGGLVAVIASLA